ncbi:MULTISPECIES: hypothetical protein [Sphingobacterium]|uniref:Uncharacterized protein n=1 Tax=Sphingobacterium kitahiroshimense TaxID=470446 RepID=A0ABV0BS34_9SPHI|nr:hypothetical protein [Sphingobacterium sp. JUb56]MBB2954038.1 hypothetical protein [Sphingobacterium sp. JUb56]
MNKTIVTVFFILSFFFGVSLIIYQTVTEFYNKRCIEDKYGVNYNDQRIRLGLSTIPSNWSIKWYDSSVEWKDPVFRLGHRWKNISFKGCRILNELDLFVLEYDKHIKQYNKIIKIEAEYDENEKLKTVIYSLQVDDYSREISKAKADSLLSTIIMDL